MGQNSTGSDLWSEHARQTYLRVLSATIIGASALDMQSAWAKTKAVLGTTDS
jgi:hypothetical protein